MRKLFLDNLPRFKKSNKINWKDCSGFNLKLVYDNIEYEVEIDSYRNDYLVIKCFDDTILVKPEKLESCLLGICERKYKHNIYDIIDTKTGAIVILKKIKIKDKRGYNQKGYIYLCLLCGNISKISESNLSKGVGCNTCSNKRVIIGLNDLWTTHPDIAEMLKYNKLGYSLHSSSHNKETFICPHCGYENFNKEVCSVVRYGLNCSRCSDKISYPEKLMFSVLKELNIYFEKEKTFEWSKNIKHKNKKLCGNKRYDFYIPSLNCIIETHGIQHYKNSFSCCSKDARSVEEEQKNDKLKEELAKENGINHYIIINCKISDLEFIKKSIINSELSNIFDLKRIDWCKCEENCSANITKNICEIWEANKNIKTLKNQFKVTESTIRRHLIKGQRIGWCTYKGYGKRKTLNT